MQGQRWLPFEDKIDWSRFAIVLSEDEMKNGGLKKRIDAAKPRVSLMQEELRKVRNMFTYNNTLNYIVDSLRSSDL